MRKLMLIMAILLMASVGWCFPPTPPGGSAPAATEAVAGISERCTDAEMTTGTKTDCDVTPANAKVELDKKQASDADLTAIAALACSENQIIKRNGAGAWICAADGGGTAGKVCKTITNPSDSDNLLFDITAARTITKISGICVGGTSVVITLQDAGADGSGSTAIDDAITMDTNGANGGAITYAIDDGDIIKLDIGTVTGVVTQVMVCYE